MVERAKIFSLPVASRGTLDSTINLVTVLPDIDSALLNPFEELLLILPTTNTCFIDSFTDVHGRQTIAYHFGDDELFWRNASIRYTCNAPPMDHSIQEVPTFLLSFRTQPTQMKVVREEYSGEDVPVVRAENNSAQTCIIAGSVFDVEGPVQTDPSVLFLDVCLKQVYRKPSTYDLAISERFDVGLIYIWKTSKPDSSVVCTLTPTDGPTQQLPWNAVAIVQPFDVHIKLRLLDQVDSCRLLIIAGNRVHGE